MVRSLHGVEPREPDAMNRSRAREHDEPSPASESLPPAAVFASCHEIMNALSCVSMNIQYLAAESSTSEADRAAAAADAHASVERIAEIVRALQGGLRRSLFEVRDSNKR
jgi:hypothetical protein